MTNCENYSWCFFGVCYHTVTSANSEHWLKVNLTYILVLHSWISTREHHKIHKMVFACLRIQGAFWGLMMGLCRMVPVFWFRTSSCIFPSNCPFLVCGIHYLYFAIVLFVCTSVLVLLVIYCTKPIDHQHVRDLL